MQPLSGVRVLDFSTLLPGPMATLVLAEAGAEVIKIERPAKGDDMRHYPPKQGQNSASFALLNRGKTSVEVDLKDPDAVRRLTPLIRDSHILIEQFRPGVMDRLGLGYETVRAINPALVYCAITGYGQDGPDHLKAGHDLNYIAEAGLLGLSAGTDGAPVIPPGLIADIGGGAYPAVMNILMALRQAEKTGEGCYLDISMSDNLFPWMFWALAKKQVTGEDPAAGGELLSGGSPRFRIYQTADHRYIAVAALEQHFWINFCELIALPEDLRRDHGQEEATGNAIARILAGQTAAHWQALFDGQDVCCSVVATLEEALDHPHFQARGLFARRVATGNGGGLTALPVPLAPALRQSGDERPSPPLGNGNGLLPD